MRLWTVLPLVVLAASAGAQERVRPAKGVFLVAEARIDSGPFERSVVLLLAHGGEGTIGLIVNRPTDIPLRVVRYWETDGTFQASIDQRPKDREFCRALIDRQIVEVATLNGRLAKVRGLTTDVRDREHR